MAAIDSKWSDEHIVELGEYLTSPTNTVTEIIVRQNIDYRVLEKGLIHPNSKVREMYIQKPIGFSELCVLRSVLTSPGCKLFNCEIWGIDGVAEDIVKDIFRDIISHPNFRMYGLRLCKAPSSTTVGWWVRNRMRNDSIRSKTLFEMCTELLVLEKIQIPIPILTLCVKEKMGAKEYHRTERAHKIINHLLHLLNG